MKKIKIIGCGNLLAYDEGIGIHIVRRLNNEILPENVEVKELRTPGQLLVELLSGADKLIIIDACSSQCESGTVHRYSGSETSLEEMLSNTIHAHYFYPIFELRKKLTPHKMPDEMVVIAVEIEDRQKFCIGLSKSVFASIDDVVNTVINELY
ncbi:MAG: hydrogenase maturation protease [Bacillota bacterium]|nr:hydrogenase maturation protease [Bacillota bacterium]